jgi:hypothetical protein
MIRIETTAEFDAEGKFTVTAQAPMPVPPGSHPIIIQVPEINSDTEGLPAAEADSEPAWKKVGELLVFTGELLEDPEEVRRRLDEERARQLFYGPFE